MGGLTEDDYLTLMRGGNRGNHYSGNHYIVRRDNKEKQKNPVTKETIFLNENVGMPHNYNQEYDGKVKNQKAKKKRKIGEIDPQLLQYLNSR